jgi:hypothetical protein
LENTQEHPPSESELTPELASNFFSDQVREVVEEIKSPPQPLSNEQFSALMTEIISMLQDAIKKSKSRVGSAVESQNLYNSLQFAKAILQPDQRALPTREDYRNFCSEAIELVGVEGGLQDLVRDLQNYVEVATYGEEMPALSRWQRLREELKTLFYKS